MPAHGIILDSMTDNEAVEKLKQMMAESPLGYFSAVFSKKNPELCAYVMEHSKFLDGKVDPKHHKPYAKSTRIAYAVNGLSSYPLCCICGSPVTRNLTMHDDVQHLHCCNKCAQLDAQTIAKGKTTKLANHGDPNFNNMAKSRATCMERYGVECSWQADAVKDTIKQSLVDHYGVDHPMRSREVVDCMKKRYKEKHGVEHAFQDPAVQAKINAANQQKLGVDWPMQSPALRKVMHENSSRTQKKKYFNEVIMHNQAVEPLFTEDEWVERSGWSESTHKFKWRCKKCGNVFEGSVVYGHPALARCYRCNPVLQTVSNAEREVAAFICSLGNGITAVNHKPENRQLIPPYEVDIIAKKGNDIKLLIEVDGLYWHSTTCGKSKLYHLEKTKRCMEAGHQLVHIFEDEWVHKRSIVESRLKAMLGVYDSVVHARKCTVKSLSAAEARDFFSSTHLQGNAQASIRYGLAYGGVLVAAMSFGRRRKITNGRSSEGEYELVRFATKLGCHVVGAAGKLLAHFEREVKPVSLLSYADKRWSVGKLYYALGFELDHESGPSYWYMTGNFDKRMYRYAFRKSAQPKLLENFDPSKSELENMLANGYHVIWDCGNYVFIKHYRHDESNSI